MAANKQQQASWTAMFKAFYYKHPIFSNFVFIILTAMVLGWLALIFLDVWTRHGDTAVVPIVKNMKYDEAAAKLEADGFLVEISDSVYDPTVAPGTVLESWPRAGATVKPGREIYLTITSFQPRKVRIGMPLRDVSSRQAMSYLESIGIKNIRLVEVPSEFPDLVMGAKYEGKSLEPGMEVPVTAVVTLEVGVVPTVQQVDVDALDSLDYDQDAAIDAAIRDALNQLPAKQQHSQTQDDPSAYYD